MESYKDTAGLGKGISCLTKDWILLRFARERGKAEIGDRQFVLEGTKEKSPWKELKGQLYHSEVYEAHIRYGYTLKDIADYLGVHYATISRAVRKVEKRR